MVGQEAFRRVDDAYVCLVGRTRVLAERQQAVPGNDDPGYIGPLVESARHPRRERKPGGHLGHDRHRVAEHLSQARVAPRGVAQSAHRGGGRVFAPDNSWPNIEHALTLGVTAIEIDLRATADRHLVLSHDDRLPKALFGDKDRFISRLMLVEVRRLRYSTTAGGHTWTDLTIPVADEVVGRLKNQINFQLDVKDTPVDLVLDLIRRQGIADRVVVSSRDIDYLRQIKRAEPRVVVEWAQNTLGRYQAGKRWKPYPMPKQLELYHEAMKRLTAIGGEMLCTKLLTAEKVALCHRYGVCVRPSVQSVGPADGVRFLRLGCDGLLADDPAKVLDAAKQLLGPEYLPQNSQTVRELIQALRHNRPRSQ